MKRFLILAMACLFLMDAQHAAADNGHGTWLEFLKGKWSYAWKEKGGEFSESGSITYRAAANKKALIGRIETENDDKEIEIVGWNADSSSLVVTGYSSNGSCWTIEYTQFGDNDAKSTKASGIMPDGRPWKATSWVLTKVNENECTVVSKGTTGGKPSEYTAKFTREDD